MTAIKRGLAPGLEIAPPRWSTLVPLSLFVACAVLPVLPGVDGDGYLLGLISRVMIFAVAALALDLLVGFGGMVSLGHAASVGIGAYAVAILSAHGVNDALISLPVALAAAALFSLLSGIVCLRTSGPYFIMITLAVGQMVFFVASSLASYGGDDGLTMRSRNTVANLPLFQDDRAFYYVVLAFLILAYLFCRSLIVSRFGWVFRGTRENARRMSTLGFDVERFRLVAYVIVGTMGGAAGFLLANATSFVSPAYMSWQRSGELLIMVILGGSGTLNGALVGTVAFIFLEEWLADFTEHWKLIFGPLLVLAILFVPGGLGGLAAALLRRFRRG